MEAGRNLHRGIDLALPDEGAFEVRLRRAGISARIDLLSDVPVEIKTGDEPPPDDLAGERPEYVEQIALYCALLARDRARLVHVQGPADGPPVVRAFDLGYHDPAVLSEELERRAASLRAALGSQNASSLPRCRWHALGCEYRAAGLCDCRGDEELPSSVLVDQAQRPTPRDDISDRWARALRKVDLAAPTPGMRRYRDLVYPRRAYFDAVAPAEPPAPRVALTDYPPSDVYDSAVGALEGGPVGEVHRLPEFGWTPEEEVAGWRGEPYIVRTSRAWSRLRADEAVTRFPQYALELGFRCAATGTRRGHLVVAYERAERLHDRLQVLEYSFGSDLASYASLLGERRRTFERALSSSDPSELAVCADWMVPNCPYRASCGCGEGAPRSQR